MAIYGQWVELRLIPAGVEFVGVNRDNPNFIPRFMERYAAPNARPNETVDRNGTTHIGITHGFIVPEFNYAP